MTPPAANRVQLTNDKLPNGAVINIQDPQQTSLFDLAPSFLSEMSLKRIETSTYAVFRHVILSLMPVDAIGKHFSRSVGRRTKELYSMAGLLLLKEFRNWTTSEATQAYLFDYRVQYALNIGRDNISFCERTLERYMTIMREDKLAIEIFDTVTAKLIEELGIEISAQRLEVAQQLHDIIQFFNGNATIETMDTYKQIVKIFNQQCEVTSLVETKQPAENNTSEAPQPATRNLGMEKELQ